MGKAAKKNAGASSEDATAAGSPAVALRAELFDAARKAAKSAKGDEALHHFIAVFILDANLASRTQGEDADAKPKYDQEAVAQIKKIAKKIFGEDRTKLWVAFADVHQEMVGLLTPITKPMELAPSLQLFRDVMKP